MTEVELKEVKMYAAKDILEEKFLQDPPISKYITFVDSTMSKGNMNNVAKAINVLAGIGYSKPQLAVCSTGNTVLGYVVMERLVNE